MRLLLKVIAFPIVIVLTLFVWLCAAVLYCSAYVLGMIGFLIGLLAVGMFLSGSSQSGVLLLVIAYLVSPLGLPMAAVWLLTRVQAMRYTVQNFVFG